MISIIIPLYREEKNIERLLKRLEIIKGDVEFIFVDGGDDRTFDILKAKNLKVIKTEKGRGKQLIEGVKEASGDILFFLHADSYFKENPVSEIERISEKHGAGAFSIRFEPQNWFLLWGAIGSNMRVRNDKIAFGDQGIFIRRDVYEKIGGFKDYPLFEDYDISERLRNICNPIIQSKQKIYTSPRRYQKNGYFKTYFNMKYLQILYEKGVDPYELDKKYR